MDRLQQVGIRGYSTKACMFAFFETYWCILLQLIGKPSYLPTQQF